jgi:hypothetical protein
LQLRSGRRSAAGSHSGHSVGVKHLPDIDGFTQHLAANV